MNKPSRSKPEQIREMFGTIADRYDLLNRVLSLCIDVRWRRTLTEHATRGDVLDVACGTGDVLKAFGSPSPRYRRVGVDFSYPMLRQADDKLDSGTRLVQGDALDLPLVSGCFDTVTVAFGVRNFADRPRAFREFRRLIRPGGRLLILEFFPPENGWLLRPYRFYLRTVLPRIGQWLSGSNEAYGYLRDSVESFASRDQVRREVIDSGFEDVWFEEMTGGIATLIVAEATG